MAIIIFVKINYIKIIILNFYNKMSTDLITTVLTHSSSFLINNRGTAYLKIEVFFSKETKKYQMKFIIGQLIFVCKI